MSGPPSRPDAEPAHPRPCRSPCWPHWPRPAPNGCRPLELAYAAHRLEVDTLGIQSGIQDQLCAAFGGINDIEVDPYPEARSSTLPAWPELDSRLTLVFLGRAHNSSDLHGRVIAGLDRRGPGAFVPAP